MKLGLSGLGTYDPPPEVITPQSIREYLKSQYNFEDSNMGYSNLWAQQIQGGNSWENFYRYFERMGLSRYVKPLDESLVSSIVFTYEEFLQRKPTETEIKKWYDGLQKNIIGLSELRNTIMASDEYKIKHPELPVKKINIVPALVAGAGVALLTLF